MPRKSEELKGLVIMWRDKFCKRNMLHLSIPPCDPPWPPCKELTKFLKSDILESLARVHIEKFKEKEYQITIRFEVP
jgi:hypothetical protein